MEAELAALRCPSACGLSRLRAGCTGSAGCAGRPSHSRRARARLLALGLRQMRGEVLTPKQQGRHGRIPVGSLRSSVLARVRVQSHRRPLRRAHRILKVRSKPTHDSGAATSTAPARHTRHARRVTPQMRTIVFARSTGYCALAQESPMKRTCGCPGIWSY